MPRPSSVTPSLRRKIYAARSGKRKTPWKILERNTGFCRARLWQIFNKEKALRGKKRL